MTIKLNGAGGYTALDAHSSAADNTLVLPQNNGSANQVLKTDGSGNLAWVDQTPAVTLPNIKEIVAYPCDGGTYSTINGNITAPNVTAMVKPGTSYEDIAGSVVTYQPPTGTTAVIYEYNFSTGSSDSHGILHFRAAIAGTEIGYYRWTGSANNTPSFMWTAKLVIPIGGTADANTGRQASWTSGKEIKIKVRNYHANNEAKLYSTYYYDGGTSSTFCQPNVQITAIG